MASQVSEFPGSAAGDNADDGGARDRMIEDASAGYGGMHGPVREGQRNHSEPVVARNQASEPGYVDHHGLSFRTAAK